MLLTPSNSPRVHVLPWDAPLTTAAAEWLASDWSGQEALDLSDTIVLVPTRQSGRRLREALASHAGTRGQAVFPPRVLQPELILDLARPPGGHPTASRAALLLGWVRVLREAALGELRAVFPVDPPQRHFAWALQLAEEFARLQDALAEGGLRFADVATRAGENFAEVERWTQLGELERRLDVVLAEAEVEAPAIAQHAARTASEPPPGIKRVVLLATSDPRPIVLEVLESWIPTISVVVLVYAAAGEHDRFDAWGRPRPEAWTEAPLELPEFESRVHVCSDPSSQAESAAAVVAAYRGRDGAVALGCADAELVPRLAGALTASGVVPYLPQGTPWRAHPLADLLEALLAAVRDEAWEPAAALARHAAVLEWLRRVQNGFSPARWLEGLDELAARHLPPTLNAALQHARTQDMRRGMNSRGPQLELDLGAGTPDAAPPEQTDPPAARIRFPERVSGLERLTRLIRSLRTGAFPANWHEALAEIFGGHLLDTTRPEDQALLEAANEWQTACAAVAAAAPPDLAAADACQLALRLFGASRHFADKPARAVDIDGWLELLFRREPHLLVVGFNEGAVPEAITAHAFLPENLRARLGLKTNAHRLARDAWQLAALVACRRRSGRVDIFLGKTSAAGDPLRPSRLLFRCEDEALPERVSALFRELPPSDGNVPWQRGWRIRPPRVAPPRHLRVTAFRDYLRCPFRFYLKHALKLQPVEADKRELDPRDFGDLVHRVLERLGQDATWRDCMDDRVLAAAFSGELDRLVAGRYGSTLALPLIVQVESARQRLAHAARVQAETRAEGWVIHHVEWPFPPDQLALGGLGLRGTIDRIERHAETGAWRVLDYKTAESAVAPEAAHWRGERASDPADFAVPEMRFDGEPRPRVWTDLQLPLYRWALGEVFGVREVSLGYFNLPKAVGETAITLWEDYDAQRHDAAVACATAVAQAVAAGRFWPPAEDVRNDDFASLFHEGVAESVEWEERS